MKEIWEALQTSGFLSVLGGVCVWIICHVIYAVITAKTQHKYDKELEEKKALIQHDCDIRLERYRLEFNQILAEYQIRFGYWYTEKAKAINVFYKEISKLYSLMQIILSKEQANVCSKEDREILYMELAAKRKEYKKKLEYLKLYFEEEEEKKIEDFVSKENKFFIKYLINKTIDDRDSFVKDGKLIIDDMSSIMTALRQEFLKILTAQSNVIKYNERERKA